MEYGTQTNCGGVAGALVDFEPGAAFRFVAELSEPARSYAAEFEAGVRSALLDHCGGSLPPVLVTLRWILVHEVDSHPRGNREAGRRAVAEALRRAGILT